MSTKWKIISITVTTILFIVIAILSVRGGYQWIIYPDSIGDGYLNRHEVCVFLLNLRVELSMMVIKMIVPTINKRAIIKADINKIQFISFLFAHSHNSCKNAFIYITSYS